MKLSYCSRERKPCVRWVEKFFNDCLCNLRDDMSFGLGLISLVCWGVAEIPQIITNFRAKSGHGVSLAFLLTWVLGDIFNLVGCLLEPATLPTQYYTALLYTTTTIVLVFQSVYYDHIGKWWKNRQTNLSQEVEEHKEPLKTKSTDSGIPIPSGPLKASPPRDFYYTSARSLAGSNTPTFGSYLRTSRSGPPVSLLDADSSSDDEHPKASSKRSTSRPRPIPRSAGPAAFLSTYASLPFQSNALKEACIGLLGRKILHEQGTENNTFGQWLGWMMALIYIGGRIPQICLNMKRGSVEGLNPLMFIFALTANISYVGSIVVRSTEWSKIKANMPWLLDAVVCVALDLFIISQYIYYRYFRETAASGNDHGDYKEAE